jgi:hypothetical protein
VPTIFGNYLEQETTTSRRRNGMKTIDNLLGNEGINAAAVLALSGTLMVLVAKGNGPLSLKGIVSGTLSNPVPRPEPTSARDADVSFGEASLSTAA